MTRYLLGVLFIALLPSVAKAADVKVTDHSGHSTVVKDVRIDYTSYSLWYTPDFESEGVRVLQGDATVTVRWSKIEKLTIKGRDAEGAKGTPGIKAEIAIKNGDKKDVELEMDSKEGLTGETDLGKYSIHLQDINTIEIVNGD
jgi:hypothetical protein